MLTYVKYAILHMGVKWMRNMDQCGSFVVQDLAIIGYIYFVLGLLARMKINKIFRKLLITTVKGTILIEFPHPQSISKKLQNLSSIYRTPTKI